MKWAELEAPAGSAHRLWACEAGYGVLIVTSPGMPVFVPDASIEQDQKSGKIKVVPLPAGANPVTGTKP
jgi:hypothetical protein|tara:strand:+ start:102 stop:308 length:207 start_codon:yes stop_codon:yes gene_type:complete